MTWALRVTLLVVLSSENELRRYGPRMRIMQGVDLLGYIADLGGNQDDGYTMPKVQDFFIYLPVADESPRGELLRDGRALSPWHSITN